MHIYIYIWRSQLYYFMSCYLCDGIVLLVFLTRSQMRYAKTKIQSSFKSSLNKFENNILLTSLPTFLIPGLRILHTPKSTKKKEIENNIVIMIIMLLTVLIILIFQVLLTVLIILIFQV